MYNIVFEGKPATAHAHVHGNKVSVASLNDETFHGDFTPHGEGQAVVSFGSWPVERQVALCRAVKAAHVRGHFC